MIYKVLFLDGNSVTVEADDFSHNDVAKRIYFMKDDIRIAGFNFNNIIGFYRIEEENE